MKLKEVNFVYNENLSGKSLTNDNITSCFYYGTNLCSSNINTLCEKNENSVEPCEETLNACETIESYLKENNINMEINCKLTLNNKRIDSISINEEIITEEALDKILSFPLYEKLTIYVDNSKNLLEKIGKQAVDLKRLYIYADSDNKQLLSLKSGSLKYFSRLYDLILSDVNLTKTVINEIGNDTSLVYL
ncbi:hypothetical protein PIROE2DRAFT_9846 [Piromyces sp. E2]|nr:hypothetical protein PIROE2DRAFT_9846 [Piromyces sp. E2]|eukprot:OUM63566.1 hypothetical protein PIROE2DRAFT_9846 [Piromyces sp. E2]